MFMFSRLSRKMSSTEDDLVMYVVYKSMLSAFHRICLKLSSLESPIGGE